MGAFKDIQILELEEILLQKNNKLFIEHNGIPLLKLMKIFAFRKK